MEKEIQPLQFGIAMEEPLLKAQRERGGEAGLDIFRTCFWFHGLPLF
jgi:hypothetical protein